MGAFPSCCTIHTAQVHREGGKDGAWIQYSVHLAPRETPHWVLMTGFLTPNQGAAFERGISLLKCKYSILSIYGQSEDAGHMGSAQYILIKNESVMSSLPKLPQCRRKGHRSHPSMGGVSS